MSKTRSVIDEDQLTLSQKIFFEHQNYCALCGSQLEIKTSEPTDFNELFEEAYCCSCNLKTRTKKHIQH